MATNHIQVSISDARQDKYTALSKLADKIGCRITDLVWHGIENVLKTPPAAVASSGTPRAGSARGFWVVNDTDTSGRLRGVSVVEVAKRSNAQGSLFIRYASGDVKSRSRAMSQAQKSASYNAALAGVKMPESGATVKQLPDKEGKAIPKPSTKGSGEEA